MDKFELNNAFYDLVGDLDNDANGELHEYKSVDESVDMILQCVERYGAELAGDELINTDNRYRYEAQTYIANKLRDETADRDYLHPGDVILLPGNSVVYAFNERDEAWDIMRLTEGLKLHGKVSDHIRVTTILTEEYIANLGEGMELRQSLNHLGAAVYVDNAMIELYDDDIAKRVEGVPLMIPLNYPEQHLKCRIN